MGRAPAKPIIGASITMMGFASLYPSYELPAHSVLKNLRSGGAWLFFAGMMKPSALSM